jgi:hypothetical protein
MKPNIRVCTPSYDGKLTIPYTDSIIKMDADDRFECSFEFLSGDSLINRARNHLISSFYEQKGIMGHTHLLWLDSDVGITIDSIDSMLKRNVDVVAAPIPLKLPLVDNKQKQSIINVYEKVEDYLYKAKYVATGALMLSSNVVDLLVQFCILNKEFYSYNGQLIYNVFGLGIKEGLYLSEDYFLCETLTEIEKEIYVDSNTSVIHVGNPTLAWIRDPMLLSNTILNKEKNDVDSKIYWVPND